MRSVSDGATPGILIISLSRSGGKLLRTLLDGHSQLSVLPFEHWQASSKNRYVEARHAEFASFDPERKLAVCGFGHAREKLRRGHSPGVVDELLRQLSSAAEDVNSFAELYDRFTTLYFALCEPTADRRIPVNHCGSLCLLSRDQIERMFGASRLVLTIRDPRATFSSMEALRMRKFTEKRIRLGKVTAKQIAKHREQSAGGNGARGYLKEFCAQYEAMLRNHHGKAGVVSVSFESLVENTPVEMRRVAEQLAIPFEDSLCTPTERGRVRSANTSFARAPHTVDAAAARDWQRRLPDADARFIAETLDARMRELHYTSRT